MLTPHMLLQCQHIYIIRSSADNICYTGICGLRINHLILIMHDFVCFYLSFKTITIIMTPHMLVKHAVNICYTGVCGLQTNKQHLTCVVFHCNGYSVFIGINIVHALYVYVSPSQERYTYCAHEKLLLTIQ